MYKNCKINVNSELDTIIESLTKIYNLSTDPAIVQEATAKFFLEMGSVNFDIYKAVKDIQYKTQASLV